ncbi:MAG: patatin-like phospholipase family protein, partial [bacterium]
RTAFVLAGGGSLGAVQVGMLKALVRHGVVPDFIVGASVGAINATYFAAEPNRDGVARLESVWKRLKRSDVFPFSPCSGLLSLLGKRDHFVPSARLRSVLEAALPLFRLEDARLPCHVVATDALSGAEVLITSGLAINALLASAAIPGVFPPVMLDGRHLIDGGVANNTPVSTAIRLGATRVIVLPTGMPCAIEAPPRVAIAIALHALNLLVMQQLEKDVARLSHLTQLIIVPPLCPLITTPYDFSRSTELIRRAEATTRLWLAQGGLHAHGDVHGLLAHGHDHLPRAVKPRAGPKALPPMLRRNGLVATRHSCRSTETGSQ